MNGRHSCRRVAELLSQRLDEPLGRFDTILLRLHLAICRNCQHVEKQLEGVKSLTAALFEGDADLEDEPKKPMAHEAGDRRPG